ncbi:MAG TPA: methionyl-tRNA formyltransferase [Steroidobacteraceae bacterium]|nr:methionyl-tRNA formyltransferase [Steroidobacteraceae bacterium]
MRIAIVGQSDFGKAALEAFVDRGDSVAGVFCAPEKPGAAADPLRIAAEQRSIPVYQLKSLKTPEAQQTLRALNADLGIMAYVLQFVPQDFATIPRHGMIQFHPSLLPRYRGPSSINWPIIRGDTRTGLTIFRPTDGLDEGPVILQKETPIGPDDTLGSVYFDRLFPMGIAALQEAAAMVVGGAALERVQDESQASYEGWCRDAEARINWHNHIDLVHNLIRGCDPAPAAWTTFKGKKLQLHAARKHPARTFAEVKGAIGAVTAIGAGSIFVTAQGGQIEVSKLRYDGGKKLPAPQACAEAGLSLGAILGE